MYGGSFYDVPWCTCYQSRQKTEMDKLAGMDNMLNGKVIGQEDAVKKVHKSH